MTIIIWKDKIEASTCSSLIYFLNQYLFCKQHGYGFQIHDPVWSKYFQPLSLPWKEGSFDMMELGRGDLVGTFTMVDYQNAFEEVYRFSDSMETKIRARVHKTGLIPGEYDAVLLTGSTPSDIEPAINRLLERSADCTQIFLYLETNHQSIGQAFQHFCDTYQLGIDVVVLEGTTLVSALVAMELIFKARICICDYESDLSMLLYMKQLTDKVYDMREKDHPRFIDTEPPSSTFVRIEAAEMDDEEDDEEEEEKEQEEPEEPEEEKEQEVIEEEDYCGDEPILDYDDSSSEKTEEDVVEVQQVQLPPLQQEQADEKEDDLYFRRIEEDYYRDVEEEEWFEEDIAWRTVPLPMKMATHRPDPDTIQQEEELIRSTQVNRRPLHSLAGKPRSRFLFP